MRMPDKYTADAIKELDVTSNKPGSKYWFLARPEPYHWGWRNNWIKRVKYAWLVFTGKADVVTWIDQ